MCTPPHRIGRSLLASPQAPRRFRAELRHWLSTVDASAADKLDILTATGEAITNAVQHPLQPSIPLVMLSAITEDEVVRISVRDWGRWREQRLRGDRGYGLTLMRSLMDSVTVSPDQIGTTILMLHQLQAREAD